MSFFFQRRRMLPFGTTKENIFPTFSCFLFRLPLPFQLSLILSALVAPCAKNTTVVPGLNLKRRRHLPLCVLLMFIGHPICTIPCFASIGLFFSEQRLNEYSATRSNHFIHGVIWYSDFHKGYELMPRTDISSKCLFKLTQSVWTFAWMREIGCLTSTSTIFQLNMWRHIDVQVNWRSWTYGRAPNAIDIS